MCLVCEKHLIVLRSQSALELERVSSGAAAARDPAHAALSSRAVAAGPPALVAPARDRWARTAFRSVSAASTTGTRQRGQAPTPSGLETRPEQPGERRHTHEDEHGYGLDRDGIQQQTVAEDCFGWTEDSEGAGDHGPVDQGAEPTASEHGARLGSLGPECERGQEVGADIEREYLQHGDGEGDGTAGQGHTTNGVSSATLSVR